MSTVRATGDCPPCSRRCSLTRRRPDCLSALGGTAVNTDPTLQHKTCTCLTNSPQCKVLGYYLPTMQLQWILSTGQGRRKPGERDIVYPFMVKYRLSWDLVWYAKLNILCTLVSALKLNMAAIFRKPTAGKKNYFYFFPIFFHTDHYKYKMK